MVKSLKLRGFLGLLYAMLLEGPTSHSPKTPGQTLLHLSEVRIKPLHWRIYKDLEGDGVGPGSRLAGRRHNRGRGAGWERGTQQMEGGSLLTVQEQHHHHALGFPTNNPTSQSKLP